MTGKRIIDTQAGRYNIPNPQKRRLILAAFTFYILLLFCLRSLPTYINQGPLQNYNSQPNMFAIFHTYTPPPFLFWCVEKCKGWDLFYPDCARASKRLELRIVMAGFIFPDCARALPAIHALACKKFCWQKTFFRSIYDDAKKSWQSICITRIE